MDIENAKNKANKKIKKGNSKKLKHYTDKPSQRLNVSLLRS